MSIYFKMLVRIASYRPQIDQSHGKNRLGHIIILTAKFFAVLFLTALLLFLLSTLPLLLYDLSTLELCFSILYLPLNY